MFRIYSEGNSPEAAEIISAQYIDKISSLLDTMKM
jgi:hypothetical protein